MSRRTWAELEAFYANNDDGLITAERLRDGFNSVAPHVVAAAPTTASDSSLGFDVGHGWIDTSTSPQSLYVCVNASLGAAVWVNVGDAEGIAYDNATSGLTAVNVQAALDELAGGSGGSGIAPASGLMVVRHGSNASAARPGLAAVVLWQGSADPVNRVLGDWWHYHASAFD